MKRIVVSLALFVCSLVSTACGGSTSPSQPPRVGTPAPTAIGVPEGEATTWTVGPEGGTLVVGGLALEVPADALTDSTTIEIQPISNEAWGGIGQAYRLGPEEIAFSKPVRLFFSYEGLLPAGNGAELVSIAYQDEEGFWRAYDEPEVDPVSGVVGVETTHFSDWSAVSGMQLSPMSAKVKTGGSLLLQVSFCERIPLEGMEPAVSLLAKCRVGGPDEVPYFVGEWSVNGVVGGSGEAGTIAAKDEVSAIYVAPGEEPAANPVRVSAQVDGALVKTLLVAEIEVEGDDECDPRWDPDCSTCTPSSVPGTVKGSCSLDEKREHQCFMFTGPESHLDEYRETCPHRNDAIFSEESCVPPEKWLLGCCLRHCGLENEEVQQLTLDSTWPASEVERARESAANNCRDRGGTWLACPE